MNKTSKLLQSPSVTVDVLNSEITATLDFLQKYRETGFASACTDGREIAEKLDVQPIFPEARSRRRKDHFSYKSADEVGIQSTEERFKIEFYETRGSSYVLSGQPLLATEDVV